MNRTHADADFSSLFVESRKQGFAGLELHRASKGEKKCVARIIYWDAMGQFFFETFNTDVPLDVVEELIAEAKAAIKVR